MTASLAADPPLPNNMWADGEERPLLAVRPHVQFCAVYESNIFLVPWQLSNFGYATAGDALWNLS